MDQEQKREQERQRWREKYGEEIDCAELTRVASVVIVQRARVGVAALRRLSEYAELLKRHRQEVKDFLQGPVPGESQTMADHLKALWSAEEGGEPRRIASIRVLKALFEGSIDPAELEALLASERDAHESDATRQSEARIRELIAVILGLHPDDEQREPEVTNTERTRSLTGRARSRRDPGWVRRVVGLFELLVGSPSDHLRARARTADAGELLQALVLAHRALNSRSRELITLNLQNAPLGWEGTRKAPDTALAEAALGIAEWMRARHRNERGEPDAAVDWADVFACLEFHGNDMRYIGGKYSGRKRKADAIKGFVDRHLARVERERAKRAEMGRGRSDRFRQMRAEDESTNSGYESGGPAEKKPEKAEK